MGEAYDILNVIQIIGDVGFEEIRGFMNPVELYRQVEEEDRDFSDEEFNFLNHFISVHGIKWLGKSPHKLWRYFNNLAMEKNPKSKNFERPEIICVGIFAIVVQKIPLFDKYKNV